VAERGDEDWHDNWVFVPAYNNGNEPLGRWAARVKATIRGWYSNGNRSYDIGAVVVEEKDGRPIASATGSLGWMFNAERDQDWRELGYPGAGDLFDAKTMWECFAPYAGGDGGGSSPGPTTSKIEDCDMTGGASGGPWVVSFENCPQCYINGVNSWWWWQNGHVNIGTQWASPYHGSAALNLLRTAAGF
jgi:V8-like Glu-specific endopeptidase